MLRNYPISDAWLHTTYPTAPLYCDIEEIRNDPVLNVGQPENAMHGPVSHSSSAYLDWVIANDPGVFTLMDGSNPTKKDHVIAAKFNEDCGCRVGDVNDGNNIRGILKNSTIITTGEFTGGINHNEVYKRIYRQGTEVEKFWFLGL